MKYKSFSARPSTVGKTIRIQSFSATLDYPSAAKQNLDDQGGKRIRNRRETKGKYNRRGRLSHLEWIKMVRGRAKARRYLKDVDTVYRRIQVLGDRFVRAPIDFVNHGSEVVSGGIGSKVDKNRVRLWALSQIFSEIWPVRMILGVQSFFSRWAQGVCQVCGNHSGAWGFAWIGCHLHAVMQLQRLRDAVNVEVAILDSVCKPSGAHIPFSDIRDIEAVLACRVAIGTLVVEADRLQDRFVNIWGPLAVRALPSNVRVGWNMVSLSLDLARMSLIVGSSDPVAALAWGRENLALISKRQATKAVVKKLVRRDPAVLLRELVGVVRGDTLVGLLANPLQFIRNNIDPEKLFARYYSGGIPFLGFDEFTVPIHPGLVPALRGLSQVSQDGDPVEIGWELGDMSFVTVADASLYEERMFSVTVPSGRIMSAPAKVCMLKMVSTRKECGPLRLTLRPDIRKSIFFGQFSWTPVTDVKVVEPEQYVWRAEDRVRCFPHRRFGEYLETPDCVNPESYLRQWRMGKW